MTFTKPLVPATIFHSYISKTIDLCYLQLIYGLFILATYCNSQTSDIYQWNTEWQDFFYKYQAYIEILKENERLTLVHALNNAIWIFMIPENG